jgi:Transcriptional regulators
VKINWEELKILTNEQKEFLEIMHSIKHLNMGMIIPTGGQINPGDFHTLKAIMRCKDEKPDKNVRVSDIVNRMPVPAPAVSRGLKFLEGKGFVKRTVDVNDRRNTWVTITAEGEKVYHETADAMSDFFDAIFAKMDPGDIAAMNDGLKKLRTAAEEVVSERSIKGVKI